MLHLLRTELTYRRTSLLVGVGAVAVFVLAMVIGISPDEPESLPKAASLAVFAVGLTLLLWTWTRDQQERRLLVWVPLPVGAWEIAGARLAVPIVLQACLSTTAFLMVWLEALQNAPPALGDVVAQIAGAQGLVLAIAAGLYLSEELSVRFHRSRIALVLLNVAVVGLLVAVFSVEDGVLPGRARLDSIWVSHLVTLLLLSWSAVLFAGRPSYLLGISPIHGFPEDWSRAETERGG